MAITFDNSGKPTYMFQAGATSTDGVWYAVGAKIDTAAGYEWAGAQTFLNTVTTDATVILRDGFNNFLNPAARDAALTAPVAGTLVFVRQDAGGSPLNQIQFYNGTAWVANDGDINGVTAGTGLTGGGTSGTITVSLDTTSIYVVPSQSGQNGKYLTTDGTTSSWGTVAGYNAPTLGSTTVTSGATITTISGLTDVVLTGAGSVQDELTLILMGAL
jgi:hypothetical protein